jgi:hypothetical protein
MLVLLASAPSKVPFYVAGGLLVAWALALAAVGLTVPDFPYNKLGQRGVMLVSVLLAAAAIGTAIGTAATGK